MTVAGGPYGWTRGRLVVAGAGLALAVSLPASVVAQVVDAVGDGDPPALLSSVLVVLVLAGMAVGGWFVGDRVARADGGARRPAALGAASGLLAIAVVEAIGVARRLVADEDVAWSTIPAVVAVATALAATAAWRATQAAAARRGARTRP